VHLVGFYYTNNHSCFIISKSWNLSSNFSRSETLRLNIWEIFLVIVKINNVIKFLVCKLKIIVIGYWFFQIASLHIVVKFVNELICTV